MRHADTSDTALPAPFLGALIACATVWAFVAWEQSFWWRTKDDYGFGWLVPVFVVYTLYDRRDKIRSSLRSVAEVSEELPQTILVTAWATLVGGAILFLTGALYRAAAGPTTGGTLAVTLGGCAATASVLLLSLQTQRAGAARAFSILGLFAFPIAVWLVSAPLISAVENTLSVFLMGRIATVVFSFYDLLGFTLEQQGNVLILPTGKVGVAEACSGIRSLTGCLFAGSFLAAHFLRTFRGKMLLVLTALLFAFLANLARSLFLTGWCLAYGANSIEGTVHDVSGYSVLGLTVIGLLLIVQVLSKRNALPPPGTSYETQEGGKA